MDIKIFLASSSELKEDRNNFQVFISQLNDEWSNRDICFKLKLWEDFIDSMSSQGLQFEYDKVAGQCDIFVMLFFTKVGKYTAREFEAAFERFQQNKKPRIYTYFKEAYVSTGKIGEEIISMLEFKKKLAKLKHFTTVYSSIEDLKWNFSRQLEKIYGNKFSTDYDIKSIKNRQSIDKFLIERVCKLLSPQSDESEIQNLELSELISKASEFGRTAVFQLAKVNRRSYRTSDREFMARSIPVFEALVEFDKRKDHHAYFGQLAYALKDQSEPDWKRAEENFNTAIKARASNEEEYFYEFNRAICNVFIEDNVDISESPDTKFRELILQDLRVAKSRMPNQFKILIYHYENMKLLEWLDKNKIQLQDLSI